MGEEGEWHHIPAWDAKIKAVDEVTNEVIKAIRQIDSITPVQSPDEKRLCWFTLKHLTPEVDQWEAEIKHTGGDYPH